MLAPPTKIILPSVSHVSLLRRHTILLLIYGIPAGFFALVTGLQCAFNHSFGVVLIEHAVSAFLEMCIFSWVTGYPLLAGTESTGFYILLILMLLIASLAPATVSTVIKKIIYWLKK